MSQNGFLTPDNTFANGTVCKRIVFPDDDMWRAIITGMIAQLTHAFNYEQFGALSENQAALVGWDILNEYLYGECMIGSIFPYLTTNPPTNCIACDGSTYLEADYPKLYDVLDAQFKIDANSFFLPDLGEKFLRGASLASPLGSTGGEDSVSLTAAQNGQHTHIADDHTHTTIDHVHGVNEAVASLVPIGPLPPVVTAVTFPSVTAPASVIVNSATVTIQDSGDGEAHENKPPYYSAPYCCLAK